VTALRQVSIVPPETLRITTEKILTKGARHGVGCVHLERQPIGFLCWQHPSVIRCVTCAQRHIAGHTEHVEHSCDVCGGHLDGPDGVGDHIGLAHRAEVDTTVSIGRGRRAAIGIVFVLGWGACPPCSASIDTVEVTL